MNNKEIMDYAEEAHYFIPITVIPVVLDHGDGVYLYDVEGKEVSGLCSRYCSMCSGLQ